LIVAMNPTRGLDIGATRFVHEQLLQARERGAVVLLISTDFDEVRALSDRAAILSQGRLSDFALHAADDRNLGRMLGGMQSAPATESADA
jgi:simple sugar transport system ATP-binding protein